MLTTGNIIGIPMLFGMSYLRRAQPDDCHFVQCYMPYVFWSITLAVLLPILFINPPLLRLEYENEQKAIEEDDVVSDVISLQDDSEYSQFNESSYPPTAEKPSYLASVEKTNYLPPA